MPNTSKIDEFIQDVISLDEEKGKVVSSLRDVVLRLSKRIKEEIKYGGLVFLKGERLFCGIFVRKNHISLEFDRGEELKDAGNFLEGTGKARRHLKIFELKDIKNKKAGFYIKANYKL